MIEVKLLPNGPISSLLSSQRYVIGYEEVSCWAEGLEGFCEYGSYCTGTHTKSIYTEEPRQFVDFRADMGIGEYTGYVVFRDGIPISSEIWLSPIYKSSSDVLSVAV